MMGKKKSKKGRKTQGGDEETSPASAAMCDNLPCEAAAGNGPDQRRGASSAPPNNGSMEEKATTTSLPGSVGEPGIPFERVGSEPLSQLPPTSSKEDAKSSFVFCAIQKSTCQQVSAPVSSAETCADSTTSITGSATRSTRPSARRRDIKCPPSEKFGKLGSKLRQQNNLQLAAQEVAFGQGRDPLSLVVSYEESGLRRIVKAPDGCTSDTIVDTTLRQAVAGAALDSAGWQDALNHPQEDSYFTYSTVPEGLTIAEFRDITGKILVTPLSADTGLLRLKDDAEKKRKAAEETLENVKEYLQRMKSEDEQECSREKGPNCAYCKSIRAQLDDLLGLLILKWPLPV